MMDMNVSDRARYTLPPKVNLLKPVDIVKIIEDDRYIRKADQKCPWYIPDSICEKVEAECKSAALPYVIRAAIAWLWAGP